MAINTAYQTIVIEWCGPVSSRTLEGFDPGCLYILTGKRSYQRRSELQYIGITEDQIYKRLNNHHKIDQIASELNCWVGKVVHPEDLGRTGLERAESMLIWIAQPPLNERKRIYLPYPTSVISHWFNENGGPRYNRQGIFKKFPDVISWDGENWREGNLRVYEIE